MRDISPWRNQPIARMPETETAYVYSPEQEERLLRDYWKMVVKRRRLVALVFLVVLGVGAFFTFQETPLYTARTTLKIEPLNPSAMGVEGMLADQVIRGMSTDYYQTQFRLLKSRPLAASIITQLGLQSNPTFLGSPDLVDRLKYRFFRFWRSLFTHISNLIGFGAQESQAPQASQEPRSSKEFELGVHPGLIGHYLGLLTVTPVINTRLVQISFSTPNPSLSQQLAKAHATAFINMSLQTRFELNKEARDFLDKKLLELKARAERSEEALHRFRQGRGVVSMEGSENIVVDRMVDVNRRLTDASSRRIELESLYRMVKNKNFQYLSQVINSGMVQQLKGRIDGLEADQARLSTVFKPDHPRVLELKQQIGEAQRRLNLEIGNVVRGVESDYNAARAKEEALQAEAHRHQQAALNLKELGAKYAVLQAEVDASRAVHDSVLRRLNETNISKGLPLSNIEITEPAETPLGASSPRVQRSLLLVALCGLLLGVGLAVLLEYWDSSIKTPEDVWRALSLPTLGVVPHLSSLRKQVNGYGYGRLSAPSYARRLPPLWPGEGKDESFAEELMVVRHPLSIISEAYRTIRTSLLLSQAEKPPQVVLLTSAHPGEGKTVTTLNLAITLTQSGRTVVVVDADLRKGNCHTLLGLRNHRGLANVLSGGLALDEAVQKTELQGFSFLSRGSLAPNPADLLGSRKMQEVLVVLRERFDFILLDSPPALVLSDAAVLSELCDGVLLVVRGQETTAEAARRVVEGLEGVRAHILGVVLNGVDMRNPDYADYRSYYKSYYGEAQREKEQRG